MRPLLQRLTLLSLLAVASGFCVPAMGQQPADPILTFVGEWDLPGTSITISISKNHYVLHSKLGRGDIRWDNADYFEVTFREHSLKCHYIIRLYSQNELSVVRGEQLDPPDCDLGELRRARGSDLREPKRQEDAVQAPPPHAIAGKEPSLPANVPAEAAKPADVIQDCKDCPEVVLVSGGFFAMGSPESETGRRAEEGPVHRVGIKKFGMGRYAVTKKQYSAFVEETGYSQGRTCRVGDGKRIEDRAGYSYLNPGFPQDEAHPVVCVSWYDAIAYVSWLSKKTGKAYRLPSEAEREYATRAGAATPYSFGASVSTAAANYDAGVTPVSAGGAPEKGTTPVASFAANAFGLYQMHGNVAEWTQDCWNPSYDSAPGDGSALASGDCSKRLLRGGAFTYSAADIRSAYREAGYAQDRYAYVGFRVAREETQ
jgi:formylglycine-generating enzyme required for sulfatase activity